jgi:hypothetical protein
MKFETQTRTEQVLTVMRILAWVACIGFMVEAGAIIFSYGVSIVKPEGAKNLYQGLNLYNLKQFGFWYYTLYISLLSGLLIMKSLTALLVIKTLTSFNLQNPFTREVAWRLEKISYYSFGTWLVTMVINVYTVWLEEVSGELHGKWLSGEFIFMVGLVFIIAQIFKRGVEIQSENELTI